MTTPCCDAPCAAIHSATALAQTRTASNVYASAMRARHPSVPKAIRLGTGVLGRTHLRAPVLEQVGQRLAERDPGLPAGASPECRAVDADGRRIPRADARGVELRPQRYARHRDEHVEELLHGDRAAAADVERLLPFDVCGEPVRARHIPHVEELAARVEAPVPDDRLRGTPFGERDLARERDRKSTR